MVNYSRSLGRKPLPENLNKIATKELLDQTEKYLDFFESISAVDAILHDLAEQSFHDDLSHFCSEELRQMVECVWGRRTLLCQAGREPQITKEEKERMLKMMGDQETEERAEGKIIIDVINSTLFDGSVDAAKILIQYLSLDEQTRTDLNTGVLNMVEKVLECCTDRWKLPGRAGKVHEGR